MIAAFFAIAALSGVYSSPVTQPSDNSPIAEAGTSVDATEETTPSNPVDMALLAYDQKDKGELELAIRRAEQQNISPAILQVLAALQLSLNGRVDEALKLLHTAASDPVAKPRALAYAGELLFQTGDMQNAEPVLKAALIANPNQPNAHRYLAAYYYDVGAMDNALLHLEHVARLAPKDARPWRMRGAILSDFERHPEAIEAYRETLNRDVQPHVRQEVSLELAASLLAARQPTEALELLANCESSAESESLRAECHLSLGDFADAELSLEKAFQFDAHHSRGLMIKATLAREQGNLNLAGSTLKLAVEQHPFEFDFRAQLMSVLVAQGKRDDAEIQKQEMQRLQALRTKFTELHHESMQDPDSAKLRFELGQTAEQLGKLQMAASWYKATLLLDPEFPNAEDALNNVRSELHRQ